jgi:hypothetical protein
MRPGPSVFQSVSLPQSNYPLRRPIAGICGLSCAAIVGQAELPTCPGCGANLILALPPGGKGPRTFQCFDCDRPDPLKSDQVSGWLRGELGQDDTSAAK